MNGENSRAVLIRASAGTGKTFALATHIVRLLILGEKADEILALTFSRAAAAEIADRVAFRLAAACTSAETAAEEAERLAEPDGSAPAEAIAKRFADRPPSPADFRVALRSFLGRQHRSFMTTIDAFMARMLQAFSPETGLERQPHMMDEQAAEIQRARVVEKILGEDGSETYQRYSLLLRFASGGTMPRSFADDIVRKVSFWHEKLLGFQGPETSKNIWGDPWTIWGEENPELADALSRGSGFIAGRVDNRLSDFSAKARPIFTASGFSQFFDLFCDQVARFKAGVFGNKSAAFAEKFLKSALASNRGEEITVSLGRKKSEKIVLPPQASDAMRSLAAAVLQHKLARVCEQAKGLCGLTMSFENIYRAEVRSQGLLVFADIPRLLRSLPATTASALQWRFDSRLKHLALDEFQDTSPDQWAVLRPFADEIKQSTEDRTLFVVGDGKQAIYGWRGGDSRLFAKEAADSAYRLRSLTRSRRFSPEIADFVNAVFDPEALSASFAATDKPSHSALRACNDWSCLWEKQSSLEEPAGPDAVRVMSFPAQEAEDDGPDGAFAVAASAIAADLASSPLPSGNLGSGVAVIVSENKEGKKICEALLRLGVQAVWEGQSAISDTPVAAAILSLLALAEHPDEKSAAWGRVKYSPFATIAGPSIPGEPDSALLSRISSFVAATVARHGLPAALRLWCASALELAGNEAGAGLRERLDALVAAAADYVRDDVLDGTLSGFVEFAKSRQERTLADASVVKIVTAHRSKGLTFEKTYVPVFKTRTGFGTPKTSPVSIEDRSLPPRWILPAFSGLEFDKTLSDARLEAFSAKALETLCTFYVAFTRARRSLVILLPPDAGASKTVRFSDHVFRIASRTFGSVPAAPAFARPSQTGAECAKPAHAGAHGDSSPAARPATVAVGRIRRRTPSRESSVDHPAPDLFGALPRRSATERGEGLHDALAAIEWLDGDNLVQPHGIATTELDLTKRSNFRDALVRPSDAVELWRERAFEIIDGNQWTTGVFDRVQFRGGVDTPLVAEIFDYKTNRPHSSETPAAFAERMRKTYSRQMAAYKRALCSLTGLAPEMVRTTLLLSSTLDRVSV